MVTQHRDKKASKQKKSSAEKNDSESEDDLEHDGDESSYICDLCKEQGHYVLNCPQLESARAAIAGNTVHVARQGDNDDIFLGDGHVCFMIHHASPSPTPATTVLHPRSILTNRNAYPIRGGIPYALYLDSCATASIFGNPDLLPGIQSLDSPTRFVGFGGVGMDITRVAMHEHFGEVFYDPRATRNIVAYGTVEDMPGVRVDTIQGVSITLHVGGVKYVFRKQLTDRLYVCELGPEVDNEEEPRLPSGRQRPHREAVLHSTVEKHQLTQDSTSVPFDGPVKIFDLLEQVNTLGGGVATTGFQPEMEELKLGEVSMSTEDTGPQVSVDTITPDASHIANATPALVSLTRGESKAKTLRMRTLAPCDDNATEAVLTELSILPDRGVWIEAIRGALTFKVIPSRTFLKADRPDGKSDKLRERFVVRGDQT